MFAEIVFAVLIAVRISICHGLNCYKCRDTTNPALCQSTTTCLADQLCFEVSRPSQSGRIHSMGCLDAEVCAAMQSHILIGRSAEKRQVGMCHECCSADNCNMNLCSPPSHGSSGSFLLVANGSEIYHFDAATHMYYHLNRDAKYPTGYDFDYIDKKIYWYGAGSFYRQMINSTQNHHEKWMHGSVDMYGNYRDVAVDPISRLLFYLRPYPQSIEAVSLDTGHRVSVIYPAYGDSQPWDTSLILDLEERQVYWTCIRNPPYTIEVANYNGTQRRTIVTGIQRPIALALDGSHNRIYWADEDHKIERANKDGTNRQTVAVIKGTDFTSLTILGNDLFYTATHISSVMKISTTGGTPQPFGKSDFSNLNGIKAYNTSLLNIGSNACTIRNGGCSHVCIPTSNTTRECLCPVGYKLSANSTSCEYTTLVRLAGTNATTWQGRVEISLDNGVKWSTFCDADDKDATVLCKMLGFEGQDSSSIQDTSIFGSANSSFGTFGFPYCNGTEDIIADCRHFPKQDNCPHFQDKAVNCSRAGKLRLTGSNAKDQGRVEILMNSQWGTVCDDNFGPSEAAVVCGSLGFSRIGAVVKGMAYFGTASASTPIHLDEVRCVGNEHSLLECKHNKEIDVNDCHHEEDVGVICQAATFTQVRLVGSGALLNQGTVEISSDNGMTWNTICDDYFGVEEAQVVCNMMGFSRIGAKAMSNAHFGQGSSSLKALHFDCYGPETSLLNCQEPSSRTCSHSEDAGVICPYTTTEQLRLSNGPSANQGMVEITLDSGNTWGTVCSSNFNNKGASVICGALGYPRDGATSMGNHAYRTGSSSQPVFIQNPDCNGTESSIFDCKSTSTCSHDYDVGVMCLAEPTTLVRFKYYQLNKGLIEISVDNGKNWGTVCNDYFGQAEAEVVCRMLGFHGTGAVAVTNGTYGAGDWFKQILLDDLNCAGDETSLLQCQHKPIGDNDCTHDEDVGVACNYNEQGTGEVRLIASSSRYQGRVEVKPGGTTRWGTICSYNFDNNDASVICAMLGFQRSGAVAEITGYFDIGPESQPIILNRLQCTGKENTIFNCSGSNIRTEYTCSHLNDVGVICQP